MDGLCYNSRSTELATVKTAYIAMYVLVSRDSAHLRAYTAGASKLHVVCGGYV